MKPRESRLKPLGWGACLAIFLVTATTLRLTHYALVPAIAAATGQPYLVGYLVGWVGTMTLFFLASLAAYRLEGHALTLQAFRSRYRLGRLGRADWAWMLAMIVFSVACLAALSFSMEALKAVPFFAPHPRFPADMVDMAGNLTEGVLFEMPLRGQWWLVPVYFLGWFLNIAGEELWYRGWMLPRQEAAFGGYAWLVNGLMFNFQHTFQPWNLLAMLPGSLFVSYAVQRQGRTWMSLLWHGLLNVSLLVFIVQGVLG